LPHNLTDQYNTPIPKEKQKAFDDWIIQTTRKQGRNPLNDRYDYDVNGFFLSGAAQAANGHGSDQFKKPNHPTFSNESIYHGVDGNYGGKWIDQGGKSYFSPSDTNLVHYPKDALQGYFKTTEPDVKLLNMTSPIGEPTPGSPVVPKPISTLGALMPRKGK